jgi:hypothetical protein
MSRIVHCLLLLPALNAGAQDDLQKSPQLRLHVKAITAVTERHWGPWNTNGRKTDSISYQKTLWELNRRGDSWRNTEWDCDSSKLWFRWEKVLAYGPGGNLLETEPVAVIRGGVAVVVSPMPLPEQWCEGPVLVTRFFKRRREVDFFTRAESEPIPGSRNHNAAVRRETVYRYDPDSTLRQKDESRYNAYGQELSIRSWDAWPRGELSAKKLLPSQYKLHWTFWSRNRYDRHGSVLQCMDQWKDQRRSEQAFRYHYSGGRLLGRDEYDDRAAYLRERYRYYPNGLLRELRVYEGYKPHLLKTVRFRYEFYSR